MALAAFIVNSMAIVLFKKKSITFYCVFLQIKFGKTILNGWHG